MEDIGSKTFYVKFETSENFDEFIKGMTKKIGKDVWDDLLGAIHNLYITAYNKYAVYINDGITDELNRVFDKEHPHYLDDHESYDSLEYNHFMADEYTKCIEELGLNDEPCFMKFYVDPYECQFTGYINNDKSATISFYLEGSANESN